MMKLPFFFLALLLALPVAVSAMTCTFDDPFPAGTTAGVGSADGSRAVGTTWAQKFTPTQTCVATQMSFFGRKQGTPLGAIVAVIWSDNAGTPRLALATSTNFDTNMSTSDMWNTASITPTTLTGGTTYWFALDTIAPFTSSSVNRWIWDGAGSVASGGSKFIQDIGATWVSSTNNFSFAVSDYQPFHWSWDF